ncbi:hypothetical protein M501DRAFT_1056261 [Patellaria atrata CBS 101060]|uniref:Uncharacterized protein n=1 Tax=Patellaria atrata CBS 101060 TaxID=1346257 RepID=A0A9P4SEJ1_9PEZI|nr:hypothetical protein M501DRAFT_1056261 [Patellaria atrata CBS 101060]
MSGTRAVRRGSIGVSSTVMRWFPSIWEPPYTDIHRRNFLNDPIYIEAMPELRGSMAGYPNARLGPPNCQGQCMCDTCNERVLTIIDHIDLVRSYVERREQRFMHPNPPLPDDQARFYVIEEATRIKMMDRVFLLGKWLNELEWRDWQCQISELANPNPQGLDALLLQKYVSHSMQTMFPSASHFWVYDPQTNYDNGRFLVENNQCTRNMNAFARNRRTDVDMFLEMAELRDTIVEQRLHQLEHRVITLWTLLFSETPHNHSPTNFPPYSITLAPSIDPKDVQDFVMVDGVRFDMARKNKHSSALWNSSGPVTGQATQEPYATEVGIPKPMVINAEPRTRRKRYSWLTRSHGPLKSPAGDESSVENRLRASFRAGHNFPSNDLENSWISEDPPVRITAEDTAILQEYPPTVLDAITIGMQNPCLRDSIRYMLKHPENGDWGAISRFDRVIADAEKLWQAHDATQSSYDAVVYPNQGLMYRTYLGVGPNGESWPIHEEPVASLHGKAGVGRQSIPSDESNETGLDFAVQWDDPVYSDYPYLLYQRDYFNADGTVKSTEMFKIPLTLAAATYHGIHFTGARDIIRFTIMNHKNTIDGAYHFKGILDDAEEVWKAYDHEKAILIPDEEVIEPPIKNSFPLAPLYDIFTRRAGVLPQGCMTSSTNLSTNGTEILETEFLTSAKRTISSPASTPFIAIPCNDPQCCPAFCESGASTGPRREQHSPNGNTPTEEELQTLRAELTETEKTVLQARGMISTLWGLLQEHGIGWETIDEAQDNCSEESRGRYSMRYSHPPAKVEGSAAEEAPAEAKGPTMGLEGSSGYYANNEETLKLLAREEEQNLQVSENPRAKIEEFSEQDHAKGKYTEEFDVREWYKNYRAQQQARVTDRDGGEWLIELSPPMRHVSRELTERRVMLPVLRGLEHRAMLRRSVTETGKYKRARCESVGSTGSV